MQGDTTETQNLSTCNGEYLKQIVFIERVLDDALF